MRLSYGKVLSIMRQYGTDDEWTPSSLAIKYGRTLYTANALLAEMAAEGLLTKVKRGVYKLK